MLKSIYEIIPARLMRLLFPCPGVFPAHGRSDAVDSAYGFMGIVVFKLQKRTFIQEHAARATIFTFPGSIPVHRQHNTRRCPPDFTSKPIHLLFNLLQII